MPEAQPTLSADAQAVDAFIRGWLSEENTTAEKARHGLCFEFAEAFLKQHADAEMWETAELYPDSPYASLPLVASYEQVTAFPALRDIIEDLGYFGGHAVVVWRGLVFDVAGVSTFEAITAYFHTLTNVRWVRTS